MSTENGSPQVEDILNTKTSRRGFFKIAAGAALGATALGRALRNPDVTSAASTGNSQGDTDTDVEANAAAELLGTGETAPWIPAERYELVTPIETATMDVDPNLGERELTPIKFLLYNTNQEEFLNIPDVPNNPRDMLDLAFLKLCAGLYKNRDDVASLPNRPFTGPEMSENIFAQRIVNNYELPPQGDVEKYAELVKQGKGKARVWATDEEDETGLGLTLTTFKPELGLDVVLIDDIPPNAIYGEPDDPTTGFRVKVIKGKMQIGLYVKDRDFSTSSQYSPGKYIDLNYSSVLYGALERIHLYFGRSDFSNAADSSYLSKRQSENFALFPDIASLIYGPLSPDGLYNTAPVLEVTSPVILRDVR